MATENIRINYQVDKSQLTSSNKELSKVQKNNNLTQKEVDKTNKKFKEQSKVLASTNKAFAGLGGQLVTIGNRFTIAGKGAGDMAAGMLRMSAATSGATKAMKILRVAIAATGIGALVIAIASLVAAFRSSEAGQNKFRKLMDQIGVVVGNLSDKLAELGEMLIGFFEKPETAMEAFKKRLNNMWQGTLEIIPALGKAIKQLFALEFKEAALTAGDALAKMYLGADKGLTNLINSTKEFIDQTDKEIKLAGQLADKRAATNLLERQFWIETSKLESEVADLRLKARQEDQFSAEQRLAFLNEANELQNRLIETELTIARNRAEEISLQNTFSKSTKENLDAEAQAIAEVNRIEAKRLNQQRQLQREINTVGAQAEMEAERMRKIELERQKQEAEMIQLQKEAEFDLAQFRLEQQDKLIEAELARRDFLLENEKLLAAERQLIIEESEAKINEIKQKVAQKDIERDKAVQDAKTEVSKEGLSSLKGIAAEHTIVGKAAAIADIIISTRAAVQKAVAASPLTFGLPWSAVITAMGIANAAKVAGVTPRFEKGGRIGGNRHSQGGTVIEAERDEFVMSRNATAKYGFDFMEKINNMELNPLTVKTPTKNIVITDTKEIARQLKNMPQNIIQIDGEGFTLSQRRGHDMINKKLNRYST